MPLIDVHTHYFPPQLIAALGTRVDFPSLERRKRTTYVRYGPDKRYPLRPAMTDIAAKVIEMDKCGIDISVLSVTMPGVDGFGPDALGTARAVNDELAGTVARWPSRLAWLAVLPMDEPGAVGGELRRSVELGARGSIIYSNVAGRPLDLDVDSGLFETACELEVPILVHPAYPLSAASLEGYELLSSLGYLFDTSTAVLRLILDGLFMRYPGLKVILAHAGSTLPYVMGRIDYQANNRPGGMGALDELPSVHCQKLYVDSVSLWPPALRMAVDFFGPAHVMLGSDDPQWPIDKALETLAETGLEPNERLLIESRAATALFGIGEPRDVGIRL
jgi:aminocarboxymuconate-semialdehyde decarboxylase